MFFLPTTLGFKTQVCQGKGNYIELSSESHEEMVEEYEMEYGEYETVEE